LLLGDEEIRKLKERLEETERAMKLIFDQVSIFVTDGRTTSVACTINIF
jgi:hypothetical protein